MKKTMTLALCLMLTTIIYVSCKKSSQQAETIVSKTDWVSLLSNAAKLHNEYEDEVLSHLAESKIALTDSNSINAFFVGETEQFSKAHNLDINTFKYHSIYSFAKPVNINHLSVKGQTILLRLQKVLINADVKPEMETIEALNKLRENAISLNNEETIVAGLPVQIALSSYDYWKQKEGYWDARLNGNFVVTGIELNSPTGCKINMWKFAGADAGGALAGGEAGVGGGPLGAVAGGVLGAAFSSGGHLVNEIISCKISWWPWDETPVADWCDTDSCRLLKAREFPLAWDSTFVIDTVQFH